MKNKNGAKRTNTPEYSISNFGVVENGLMLWLTITYPPEMVALFSFTPIPEMSSGQLFLKRHMQSKLRM